jgi:hypothetical protein
VVEVCLRNRQTSICGSAFCPGLCSGNGVSKGTGWRLATLFQDSLNSFNKSELFASVLLLLAQLVTSATEHGLTYFWQG